jgi:hypothetical protein
MKSMFSVGYFKEAGSKNINTDYERVSIRSGVGGQVNKF